MRYLSKSCALFVGAALAGMLAEPAKATPQDDLRLAAERLGETVTVVGQPVPAAEIKRFYAERGHLPAWTGSDGRLNDRGAAIVSALDDAGREGLAAADYRVPSPDEAGGRAAFELRLSAAFVRYAADVGAGRRTPQSIDPELFVFSLDIDRLGALIGAATAEDPAAFLATLPPASAEYRALRTALAHYRRIAENGGWPAVPSGPTLKVGMTHPAVVPLRARLTASGDFSDGKTDDPTYFSDALAEAVTRFQKRQGLGADGAVGAKTRAALNVTADDRVGQIILNMERWRWMPDDLGQTHVFVNMAGYTLKAVENGVQRLAMRAIVGQPYRRTPVFGDRITYIELNPYWNVPYGIATQDLLPKIVANPNFLAAEGFQVFRSGDTGEEEVDPATVEWSRYGPKNFPFRLRQKPGPINALGAYKFMFPNRFNVYLHSTSAPELFARDTRAFSSGCIRVEKPHELAAFLLDGTAAWPAERIRTQVEGGNTAVARLREPVPVHLAYLTAWIDADGEAQFRDDIYGRDARLAKALFAAR